MSARSSSSKTPRFNIPQRDHLIQYMENHSIESNASTPSIKKKIVKRRRKPSRVRIGTQLQKARTDFQQLCASNNRAMEMLAQASIKQAEAASVQAQAAYLNAENESERVGVFSRLTDVIERAIDMLQ